MEFIKQNLKTIVLVTVLIIGLALAVILVQTKQIFKSKASTGGYSITSPEESGVLKEEDGSFSTSSDSIRIEISDLEKLR